MPKCFVVEHDMELADNDQHADACEHSFNHRWRNSSEPLPEFHFRRDDLQQTCQEHGDAKHEQRVLSRFGCERFTCAFASILKIRFSSFRQHVGDDDEKTSGRSTDLQW